MLLGAGLLLLPLIVVLRFPVGPSGFVVPGTASRHTIAGVIVPVLAIAGGLPAILGLAALLVGRRPPARPLLWAPTPRILAGRPAAVLLGGLALLTLALLRP